MDASQNDNLIEATDISPHIHAQLDQDVDFLCRLSFDSQAATILSIVINASILAYSNTNWLINPTDVTACENLLASNQQIRDLLEKAHSSGLYSEIRRRGEWPSPRSHC
jgi:hypothetical protein